MKFEVVGALHSVDLEAGQFKLLIDASFCYEGKKHEMHTALAIDATYDQLVGLAPYMGHPMRLTVEPATAKPPGERI